MMANRLKNANRLGFVSGHTLKCEQRLEFFFNLVIISLRHERCSDICEPSDVIRRVIFEAYSLCFNLAFRETNLLKRVMENVREREREELYLFQTEYGRKTNDSEWAGGSPGIGKGMRHFSFG